MPSISDLNSTVLCYLAVSTSAESHDVRQLPAESGWVISALVPYGTPAWCFARFTVAALPAGIAEGQMAYATNGRKVGEAPGAGTGVPVYFSNAAWRVMSTDLAVAA